MSPAGGCNHNCIPQRLALATVREALRTLTITCTEDMVFSFFVYIMIYHSTQNSITFPASWTHQVDWPTSQQPCPQLWDKQRAVWQAFTQYEVFIGAIFTLLTLAQWLESLLPLVLLSGGEPPSALKRYCGTLVRDWTDPSTFFKVCFHSALLILCGLPVFYLFPSNPSRVPSNQSLLGHQALVFRHGPAQAIKQMCRLTPTESFISGWNCHLTIEVSFSEAHIAHFLLAWDIFHSLI